MCNFEHEKNRRPKEKGLGKEEKLQRRKEKAAEKFNPKPPEFCLGVKK